MPQSIKPRRDCVNILKKPEIPSKTCKKMTEKKRKLRLQITKQLLQNST